ncbi:hypothetical protein H072_8328 [Dactylellina haptotyla CBS 200.50]|uniref:CBM1 domain-containing protein n=1 Tax=Dactylellina haptotyla (strain CBS 200.50) TaxID=1284197 RepID=S8A4N8_DACHA|nr:hypothetical protein H072_8328 [Dactylellina haptotyla CBS 200.50]
MKTQLFLIASGAVGAALAQQTAWGQCGGIGWTGPTTCVSAYTCVSQNPYYSQCIPGNGPTTAATTTSSRITTTASQTTVVTTRTTTSTTSATPASSTPIKYWFVFGDSYTDTGFNAYGTQPSTSNPLGNPNFPGNTLSGGANYVGLTITTYKKNTLFAYCLGISGATVDPSLVKPVQGKALDVEMNTFTSQYASKSLIPWTSTDTVFSFFLGINDITQSLARSDMNTYTDKILTSLMNQANVLYGYGARKFMFINVPPCERLPGIYGNQAAKTNTILWNSRLTTFVSNFKNSHSGVSVVVYDTWTDFNTVLNNPTAYGLNSNVQTYSTSQSYFWRDAYHPNVKMHDIMAQKISALWQSAGWW